MMRPQLVTLLLLLFAGVGYGGDPTTLPSETAMARPKSPIPRSDLQKMFDGMRQQTNWNIDGDMVWGYFFVDSSAERLRLAQQELEKQGDRFVSLFEPEQNGIKLGGFTLHMERIETHTVDSLDARNEKLEKLAARLRLQSYDGMDVGPVFPASRPAATRPGSN